MNRLTCKQIPVMYTITHKEIDYSKFISIINSHDADIYIKVFINDNTFEYWRATYGKSVNTLRDITMIARGIEMAGLQVEREDFQLR